MSKLTTVRQTLEAKPNVVIVRAIEINYLPDRDGYWSHTVNFHVAPKNGLYTADELQAFMIGLVPKGLKPTSQDDFRQYNEDSDLEFGKLYFDEKIGEEKVTRICTLTDKEISGPKFVNGRRKIQEVNDFRRRIWVRPFPDEAIAKDALEGKLNIEYRIGQDALRRYLPSQPGLLQRLAGRT